MNPDNNEQLRAYFLGKLSEAEAEDLEMECAAAAELTEEAEMVERELADDYLRGDLSSADAALFETNYLITEARRKRLVIARGLWTIAGESQTAAAVVSPDSFWQTIFGKRHRFQLVSVCLLLLLIGGAIFWYLSTLNVSRNDVAEVKDVNYTPQIENPTVKTLDASDQNLKVSPANSDAKNKETNKNSALPQKDPSEVKPDPIPKNVKQNMPGLAVFALFPENLRDTGEQFITIAPNVKNVKLLLNSPGETTKYQSYRAVIKTADGADIFTSPNIKTLSLTISAEKLENRTYIICLEGQNAQRVFEAVTEYTFRVRR